MSASRFLRSAAQWSSPLRASTASATARPLVSQRLAALSTQAIKYPQPVRKETETTSTVQKASPRWGQLPRNAQTTMMLAGMPQLVPFFMLNEVAYTFIMLPTLIYFMSKYILPQKVRLFMSRMFISKL